MLEIILDKQDLLPIGIPINENKNDLKLALQPTSVAEVEENSLI